MKLLLILLLITSLIIAGYLIFSLGVFSGYQVKSLEMLLGEK